MDRHLDQVHSGMHDLQPLTPLEKSAVLGITGGTSPTALARELGISVPYLRVIISRVRVRFRVTSAAEVIVRARQQGLLE